jgi:tRNA threonylcarbamoyladenosine modification (KEOPS) complex  Pcc1 subunit
MINELEILALKSIALKDAEYFTRKVCRYYSEKFHTPLAQVYELPWAFVFTNYIEHIIENNNSREQIYELAVDIFYPEKKRVKSFMGEFQSEEEEIQAWIKKIEKEAEEERQKKSQLSLKKEDKEIKQEVPAEEEKSEINMESTYFEHLEEEMKEDE